MNVHPSVFIVTYDIRHPDRLRRIYKLMRGWGDHLQYSVFRCLLSPRQLEQLKGEVIDLIHHDEDQVMFIPIGIPEGRAEKAIFTVGQPLLHAERVCRIV